MSARILIVEDDADVVRAMTQLLTNAGYDVESSMNGMDGLCMVRDNPAYDLIILDWTIRGLGGTMFVTWLNDNLRPRPPVLVVTGSPRELLPPLPPVKHVLVKPFDDKKLCVKINDILRGVPSSD